MEIGMGLIRKALFITTLGLSGRVLKDPKKKPRTQAAKKPARAAPAKPRTQKAQKSRRSKPKTARAGGTAGELERLGKLHGQGVLTDAEFSAGKAKILGTAPEPTEPTVRAARITPPYPAVGANMSAGREIDGLASRERPSVTSFNND